MPLYEYKCQSCGKTFEVIQKFSEDPLKTHAGCGGVVERLLSAPAFHLKGTGWYATDYAKSNGRGKPEDKDGKQEDKKESSGAEAKSGSSTPSESKSESKPAQSTETKSPAA